MPYPRPNELGEVYTVCHFTMPLESNLATRTLALANPASAYPPSVVWITELAMKLCEEPSTFCHCSFPEESSFAIQPWTITDHVRRVYSQTLSSPSVVCLTSVAYASMTDVCWHWMSP